MPTLTFPAAWPDLAAPVANLLAALGTPWMWWALAGAALAAGLLVHRRHPAAALALAAAAALTRAPPPCRPLPYASGLRTFDLYGLTSRVGGSRPGGEAGHRAWGLPRALAGRVELVYGVEPVPQDLDADALRRWAVECAARHPELAEGWQPLGLLHPPSRHLDVLSDIIWVRRDLLGAVSPRR